MKKSIFVAMFTLALSPLVNNSYAQNKPVNPAAPNVKLQAWSLKCPTLVSTRPTPNSNYGGLEWMNGGGTLMAVYNASYAVISENRVNCYYKSCDANNQCGTTNYYANFKDYKYCEVSKTNKTEFTCYKQ